MATRRQILALALVLLAAAGTIFFAYSLVTYDYSNADTSVEFSDGEANVTVNDMGDADEVTVKVGSETVTLKEEGETATIDISKGSQLVVTDDQGNEIKKVDIKGDSKDTNVPDDEDDDSQESENVTFTDSELQSINNSMTGSGTESDPYLITDVRELQSIKANPTAVYAIDSDIDASNTENWNDGKGFEPISEFSGTLQGQGYTISGLYINRPRTNNVGLFATTNEATINEFSVVSYEIYGKDYVGGLAGKLQNSEVTNITASGQVEGNYQVGGLTGLSNPTTLQGITIDSSAVSGTDAVGGVVGENNGEVLSVTITDTSVSGTSSVGGVAGISQSESVIRSVTVENNVTISGEQPVGGVVGRLSQKSDIYKAQVGGNIEGRTSVGGIAGSTESADTKIKLSSVRATISGTENVGGMVGLSEGVTIVDSYTRGVIEGETKVGGLVGLQTNGKLAKSYVNAQVSGNSKTGSVAGEVLSTEFADIYWVKDSDVPADPVGSGVSYGVSSEPTSVIGSSAIEQFSGFDFTNIWSTSQNGPVIRSEATVEQSTAENLNQNQVEEKPPVDLTITLLDADGNELVGDVVVGEESYAVSGKRTIEVSGNTKYEVSTDIPGYVNSSKTVDLGESDLGVTLQVFQEGVSSEVTLNVTNEDDFGVFAQIDIGDRTRNVKGTTKFDIPTGKYDLEVTAAGYEDLNRTLVVDKRQKEFDIELIEKNPNTTQLVINLRDQKTDNKISAEAVVNNRTYLIQGSKALTVQEGGTYDVEFRADSFVNTTKSISVGEKPKEVTVALEPSSIQLTVELRDQFGEPIEGNVDFDGFSHFVDGSDTFTVNKYTEYNLTANSPGKTEVSKTVNMAGDNKTVTLELDDLVSTVTVNMESTLSGEPVSGEIQVSGDGYGDTFTVDGSKTMDLDSGQEYTFSATSEGFKDAEITRSVSDEEETYTIGMQPQTVDLTIDIMTSGDSIGLDNAQVTIGERTFNATNNSVTEPVKINETYSVEVTADDHETVTKNIDVGESSKSSTVVLDPETTELTVYLKDEDTERFIDGTVEVDDTSYDVSIQGQKIDVSKYTTYTVNAMKSSSVYKTNSISVDIKDQSVEKTIMVDRKDVPLEVTLEDYNTGDTILGVVEIDGTKHSVDGSKTIDVRAGTTVDMTANSEGYAEESQSVQVDSSGTSTTIRLLPKEVSLTIELINARTGDDVTETVEFNNQQTEIIGSSSFTVEKQSEYSFILESQKWKDITDSISVGKTDKTKTYELEPVTAGVTVDLTDEETGDPISGTIKIDGEKKTSFDGEETYYLQVYEEHTIETEFEDYDNRKWTVDLEDNSTTLSKTLAHQKQDLTIEVTDERTGEFLTGTVDINGEKYEIEDGIRTISLRVNETYTVATELEQYKNESSSVDLTEEQAESVRFQLDRKQADLTINLEGAKYQEPISGELTFGDGSVYTIDGSKTFSLEVNTDYEITGSSDRYADKTTNVSMGTTDKTETIQLDPKTTELTVYLEDQVTGDALSGTVTFKGTEHEILGDKTFDVRVNSDYELVGNSGDYYESLEVVSVGETSTSAVIELQHKRVNISVSLRDKGTGEYLTGNVGVPSLGEEYYVDGTSDVPLRINTDYTLEGRKTDYYTASKSVSVGETNKSVDIYMTHKKADLTVNLEDKEDGTALDGTISINGNSYTVTDGSTTVNLKVNEDYKVTANADYYYETSDSVSLGTSDESVTIQMEHTVTDMDVELRDAETDELITGNINFNGSTYNVVGSEIFEVETNQTLDISANKDDFSSDTKSVTIDTSPKSVTFYLQPKKLTLKVQLIAEDDGSLIDTGTVTLDQETTYDVTDSTATMELRYNTEHSIKGNSENYDPTTKTISVAESDKTEEIYLSPGAVDLTVNLVDQSTGEEVSGKITISGPEYSETTFNVAGTRVIENLPVNDTYDIKITSDSYYTLDTTYDLGDTDTSTSFELEPELTTLTIELEDERTGDALSGDIELDGETSSVNGSKEFTVKVNTEHTVFTKIDDYKNQEFTVEVGDGATTETLRIPHKEVDLSVTLEDKETGTLLDGTLELMAPEYSSSDSYAISSGTATVPVRVNTDYDVTANSSDYNAKTVAVTTGTSDLSETIQVNRKEVDLTINLEDSMNGESVSGTVDVDGTSYSVSGSKTISVRQSETHTLTANATDYNERSTSVTVGDTSETVTLSMERKMVDVTISLEDVDDGSSLYGDIQLYGNTYAVDGSKTFQMRQNDTSDVFGDANNYSSKTVSYSIGSSATSRTLQLDRKEVDLTVYIKDESGNALTGDVTIDGTTYQDVSGSGTWKVGINEDHNVSVTAPDYQENSKTVSVQDTDLSKTFNMEKKHVNLTVEIYDQATNTLEPGKVSINGSEYKTASDGTITLKADYNETHDLSITSQDFDTVTKSISVGETDQTVTADLKHQLYYGGSGTSSDPYLITKLSHLDNIREYLEANYELRSDIDATDTSTWNNGAGWKPIGKDNSFNGVIDGQGHTITGLYIDRPNTDYQGFIEFSYQGTVKNVKFKNSDITGDEVVGVVASENSTYATIEHVAVEGGSVSATGNTGGVAGINTGMIRQTYSTATVSGDGSTGGLVGFSGTGTGHEDVYAAGEVNSGTDDDTINGLIGRTMEDDNDLVVTDGYWDTEATGQTSTTNVAGKALTTSEMTGSSASDNMDFNFTDVWNTQSSDYPELYWWS